MSTSKTDLAALHARIDALAIVNPDALQEVDWIVTELLRPAPPRTPAANRGAANREAGAQALGIRPRLS